MREDKSVKRTGSSNHGPRSFAAKSIQKRPNVNVSGFVSDTSPSSTQRSPIIVNRPYPAPVRTPQKANKRKNFVPKKEQPCYLQRNANFEYDHSIQKRPFQRLVKEILDKYGKDSVTQIQTTAIEALLLMSENFIVNWFEDLSILANHAKRVTIMAKDADTLIRICGKHDRILADAQKANRRNY